jgi:hypothetical protein
VNKILLVFLQEERAALDSIFRGVFTDNSYNINGAYSYELQFYWGGPGTGAPVHFHGPAINMLAHGEKVPNEKEKKKRRERERERFCLFCFVYYLFCLYYISIFFTFLRNGFFGGLRTRSILLCPRSPRCLMTAP